MSKQTKQAQAQTLMRPVEPQGIHGGTDLEQILECPVCYEMCVPPIYICTTGHSLCQWCKSKVKGKCPCCRKSVTNGRNYALEGVYNVTIFSCLYIEHGCSEPVRGDKFQSHVDTCPCRPFVCKWTSKSCPDILKASTIVFNQLVSHISQMHSTVLRTSGQYCSHHVGANLMLPVDLTKHFDLPLTLWEFDGKYFLERLLIEDNSIYVSVVIVGEKSEAVNYAVDIQLIKPGLDCAPHILKTTEQVEVESIRDVFSVLGPTSRAHLVYNIENFLHDICRPDILKNEIQWITRVNIKHVTSAESSTASLFPLSSDLFSMELFEGM